MLRWVVAPGRVPGDVLKRRGANTAPAHRYYRSMRWSVFQVARKHRSGFLQLFLQLPLELACARNATRPRAVPEGSIRRMDRLFEPPSAAAHAWEEPTVLLDSSGSWEALAGQVRARLLPAVRSAYRCPPERKAELAPEEGVVGGGLLHLCLSGIIMSAQCTLLITPVREFSCGMM